MTYEGRLRHVLRIEHGKIVRFEEFHDAVRTGAFFELLALYEKQNEPVGRTATGSHE